MKSWKDLKKASRRAIVIGTAAITAGIYIISISDNNRLENIGFIMLFFGGLFWSAVITIEVALETTSR